jgi:hypothetical protein
MIGKIDKTVIATLLDDHRTSPVTRLGMTIIQHLVASL